MSPAPPVGGDEPPRNLYAIPVLADKTVADLAAEQAVPLTDVIVPPAEE